MATEQLAGFELDQSKSIEQRIPDHVHIPFADKVEAFIARVFGGRHHCSKVEKDGPGVRIVPHAVSLATFDFALMTRIVFVAHELGVRAEVESHGVQRLRVVLHNRRSRSGGFAERHPTLFEAIRGFYK